MRKPKPERQIIISNKYGVNYYVVYNNNRFKTPAERKIMFFGITHQLLWMTLGGINEHFKTLYKKVHNK